MLKGNAIVGQSGGPTTVINSSMVGVVDAALKSKCIQRIFGMRFGIECMFDDFLLDLGKESPATLKLLRSTPSSALGSSRYKLKKNSDEDLERILPQLKKYNIRYFFLIGGNDTMDTIHRVTEYAAKTGYEMIGVGICKTVDNDLFGTDHTPGYPSAARYVALSVQQGGRLARDMQRVDPYTIFQTVGRSAGWLPAASVAGKRTPEDPPHIILMPEAPFKKEDFLSAAQAAKKKYGWVSICCGEGITYTDGTPVAQANKRDSHGNLEFGNKGGKCAGLVLHELLRDDLGWRGEAQIVESLQMCAADRCVKLDLDEAYNAGREAVRLASAGTSGVMVTIERLSKPGQPYKSGFGTIALKEVAVEAKPMDKKYIAKDGMFVTKAFIDYVTPLVGPMPEYASLTIKKAKTDAQTPCPF